MGTSTSTSNEGRYASGRSTPLFGLASHRRCHGLTQRQLGELAGVAYTTVQRLESLSRGAYPQTVHKLAVALGVEPADLLDGGEPRLPPRRRVRSASREGPTQRSRGHRLPTLLGLSTPHIGPQTQKPLEASVPSELHIRMKPTPPSPSEGLYPRSTSWTLVSTGVLLPRIVEEESEAG